MEKPASRRVFPIHGSSCMGSVADGILTGLEGAEAINSFYYGRYYEFSAVAAQVFV